MKRLALLVMLVPSLAAADKAFVAGKGATWDCKKDPVVAINHGRGNYVLKGDCKAIYVSGGHNKLVIASVDELDVNGGDNTVVVDTVSTLNVNGAKNKVTWKKTRTGDAPQVNVSGNDNQIQQAK